MLCLSRCLIISKNDTLKATGNLYCNAAPYTSNQHSSSS